jgi:hypothetical protein
VPGSTAPHILNKSYTITAEVTIPAGGAEGMIVTQGGRFGGYGLFLSKGEVGIGRGKVVFLYNLLDLKRTIWEGPELARASTPSSSTSSPLEPGLGKGGTGVLYVDGKEVDRNIDGELDPDYLRRGRDLRHRPRHAHRRRDDRVSLRFPVQVHRHDRQADLQARTLSTASACAPGRLASSALSEMRCLQEALSSVRLRDTGSRWRAQLIKAPGEAMKRALTFAAVGEASTGLALLIVPALVGRLLLGEELTGIAIPVARVAGIALVALGAGLLARHAAVPAC